MQTNHGKIKTLSDKETLKLLDFALVGHLGYYDNYQAYVLPISYAIDGDYIYMHSKPGHKIEAMRKNKNICLQVEKVSDYFHWQSAVVIGEFEELKELEASRGMRVLLNKVLRERDIHNVSPLEFDFEALLEKSIIFRMKIRKIEGRYEGD